MTVVRLGISFGAVITAKVRSLLDTLESQLRLIWYAPGRMRSGWSSGLPNSSAIASGTSNPRHQGLPIKHDDRMSNDPFFCSHYIDQGRSHIELTGARESSKDFETVQRALTMVTLAGKLITQNGLGLSGMFFPPWLCVIPLTLT